MNHQLAIIDDFFDHPDSIRKTIIESPMNDEVASDGVSYPGIVKLSDAMQDFISMRFDDLYGKKFESKLMFARHSYSSMSPPNWAHSDLNMCQYIGLIYLSASDYPSNGTSLVRHRSTGLETHPENDDQIRVLKRDSNYRELWDVTHTIPSKYNRLLVLNASNLHAAGQGFGTNRINSRLVLTVFFNLN